MKKFRIYFRNENQVDDFTIAGENAEHAVDNAKRARPDLNFDEIVEVQDIQSGKIMKSADLDPNISHESARSATLNETLRAYRGVNSEDGIASMIKIFAWISLAVSAILALALFPIPGLMILFGGVFQFALLFGFARIIEYLRRIAQASESKS